MADIQKPSLLKQLAGAAIGMTAALAIYMGYKTAAPLVTAYILPPGVTDPAMMPQGVAGTAILEDSEKYERLGARTREIAERLGAAAEDSVAVAPAAYAESEADTEVHAAALPESGEEPAAVSQTADDLQWSAQERRERRELSASLTASAVQAKPAAPAAPSATRTTAAVAGTQADVMHGGAPNLPSSGRATNAIALFAALAATAMLHRGTRTQLLAWARALR